MSHIFLIGFMGSGKSTAGELLARRVGLPFVDLDKRIEERAGRTITQVFASDGEDGFRELEEEALAAVCVASDAVVACGGGVVLRDHNRALMRQTGMVAYLAVSAEEAVARIGDCSGRPLLSGDAAKMAKTILDARLSLYRATAHHVIDTTGRTAEQVVDEIVAAIASPASLTVAVGAGDGYKVEIGAGLLDSVGEMIVRATGSGRAVLVTDENVDGLFGARVSASMDLAGVDTHRLVVPPGERTKSWSQAESVLESFTSAALDRSSVVVALGGGVVGDLAGFCAATYMRGIALAHIPTSLLAQVDSSIGGKTGVDLAAGKNLAGAFWQPAVVVSDTSVLQTLPDGEWLNGLVEVVKTAFLQGEDDVRRLERDAARLLARDEHAVMDMVSSCVRFKAGVVSDDERESGLRECLNLGHTLGHAIENVAGYGRIPHGVAVAEGMRFAAKLSEILLDTSPDIGKRVAELLDALGVPRITGEYDALALMKAMLADKKNRDSVVRFVLVTAPGEWIVRPVETDLLVEVLEWWNDTRG